MTYSTSGIEPVALEAELSTPSEKKKILRMTPRIPK